MKLVVVGSTGGCGRCFIRRALAVGHHVTAVALPGTDVGTIHEHLEIIYADVREPKSWAHALDGASGVFSALGAAGWGPTTLCRDGTIAILGAMQSMGVRRLVAITSAAMTDKPGFIFGKIITPLLLKNIYGDKRQQEDAIRQSDREWVFVRPMRLYDGPRTGVADVALEDVARGWRISREDVADFSLRQFSSDEYLGKGPVLSEPMRMTLKTFGDYAARSPRETSRPAGSSRRGDASAP